MANEDLEKLLEKMISPLRADVKEISNRVSAIEEDGVMHQVKQIQPQGLQAQPMRLGNFTHSKITDDIEETYCPSCGTVERRKVPIKTVEKEVVKDKPYVPDNYMPVPQKFIDIQHILDDMEHPDGHKLMDCPHCAPKMQDWIAKQGYVKAPASKGKK